MVPNLHTLAVSDVPLLVACRGCGHRAALGPDALPIYVGNTTSLSRLNLRCRQCGSRSIKKLVPMAMRSVEPFLAGERIEARYEVS
jgi:DNA-directed RNA polymerase subunit RPC12/RpoP